MYKERLESKLEKEKLYFFLLNLKNRNQRKNVSYNIKTKKNHHIIKI